MTARKPAPRSEPQPVDPACPSTSRHHGFGAAKDHGCRCPGPGLDSFNAYRARQRQRQRGRPRVKVDDGHVTAPDFASPDIPEPTHTATRVQAGLLGRRDLACRGHDVNTFYPRTAREVIDAKLICGRCPGQWDCLTWSLQIGDDVAVLGGTTPDERRGLRARGWAA